MARDEKGCAFGVHSSPHNSPVMSTSVPEQVLYAHVKASVRSAIDVAAIAEIKRYKTPPPAVTPVLTATLLLAEGQAADGLLTFDHSKLQDWAGVRSAVTVQTSPL